MRANLTVDSGTRAPAGAIPMAVVSLVFWTRSNADLTSRLMPLIHGQRKPPCAGFRPRRPIDARPGSAHGSGRRAQGNHAVTGAGSADRGRTAKSKKTIADKGQEIRLNREITTLLGVTRGDGLLLSGGIAVKDEMGDVHEFEPLSNDKGYLILKLSPQTNTIYWVDKAFVLTAARSRAPGQPSDELPIVEAQAGASKELAYWAAFAHGQD